MEFLILKEIYHFIIESHIRYEIILFGAALTLETIRLSVGKEHPENNIGS